MSGFLIDTNVVSELRRPRPNPGVVSWFKAVHESELFVSDATLAEIAVGIARVENPSKREDLELWAERDFFPWARSRTLPADRRVLERWLSMMHSARSRQMTLSQPDALIAATADVSGLVVVTKNARDFAPTGVATFDPFSD